MSSRLGFALAALAIGGAPFLNDALAQSKRARGFVREPDSVFQQFTVGVRFRNFLPPEVDLAARFPTPGNQGSQSSCTAWAVGYAMRSFYEGKRQNWSFASNDQLISPAYIYNSLHKYSGDCNAGVAISAALELLEKNGAPTLAVFPYTEGDCSVAPDPKAASVAPEFRIRSWRAINAKVLDDAKGQIRLGNPVVFGMDISESFENLEGDAVYDDTTTPRIGGHAMVLVGYSERRQAFKVINSWGTDWGDKGFAWISYRAIKELTDRMFVMDVADTPPVKIEIAQAPEPAPVVVPPPAPVVVVPPKPAPVVVTPPPEPKPAPVVVVPPKPAPIVVVPAPEPTPKPAPIVVAPPKPAPVVVTPPPEPKPAPVVVVPPKPAPVIAPTPEPKPAPVVVAVVPPKPAPVVVAPSPEPAPKPAPVVVAPPAPVFIAPVPQPTPKPAPVPPPAPVAVVVPKPVPVVTPPKPAPVPPVAAVQSQVTARLREVSCARLEGNVSADRTVRIKGFAGDTAEMSMLRDELLAMPGVRRVESEASIHPWPQCEVYLSFSEALAEGKAGSVRLRGGSGDTFREGDSLSIEVVTPPYPSYLYVSYLQANGEVAHLAWPQGRIPRPVAPNTRMTFGGGTNGQPLYRVSGPFGDEMIVVVASASPLFQEELPETADDRQYLTTFRKAFLVRPQGGGGQRTVSAVATPLKTQSKN